MVLPSSALLYTAMYCTVLLLETGANNIVVSRPVARQRQQNKELDNSHYEARKQQQSKVVFSAVYAEMLLAQDS
jgi:hypothetical protein